MNKYWLLGRNLVIGWYANRDGKSIDLMMLPFYFLPDLVKTHEDIAFGARVMSIGQLIRVSKSFKIKPVRIDLELPNGLEKSSMKPIENIIKRYSVTKTAFEPLR